MSHRRRVLTALAALTGLLGLAACTSSPSERGPSSTAAAVDGSVASTSAAAATSAADLGGLDALAAAAKQEGRLNVIALPPNWANYSGVISAFQNRYGITVVADRPDASSQEEVNAVRSLDGTDVAPDVVDLGMTVALANTELFAPYKVATWADIPTRQKEPTGLWVQDYSGIMAIGYDSAVVPEPTSVADLLKPEYRGAVALKGDPTQANVALNAVMMASVATGGSLDDVSRGIDFFRQLKQAGNLLPVKASAATIKDGTTPVVFDWDFLSLTSVKTRPTWRVFLPPNAVLGGFYAQAVNRNAPHPAAARLWQEFLFSDEGQNLWLKGGARPVRLPAMTRAGTADTTALEGLPRIDVTPLYLSEVQGSRAKQTLATDWAKAIS